MCVVCVSATDVCFFLVSYKNPMPSPAGMPVVVDKDATTKEREAAVLLNAKLLAKTVNDLQKMFDNGEKVMFHKHGYACNSKTGKCRSTRPPKMNRVVLWQVYGYA